MKLSNYRNVLSWQMVFNVSVNHEVLIKQGANYSIMLSTESGFDVGAGGGANGCSDGAVGRFVLT